LDPTLRDTFDRHLEVVLEHLPPAVTKLLQEVPLMAEDYPSQEVMESTGTVFRDNLCGLYTGVPLSDRSIMQSGIMSDVITIYREGILRASAAPDGSVPIDNLREEIRITILHELGHHFGMDEDELTELGYG